MTARVDEPFELPTPALLVDLEKLDANLDRMKTHIDAIGKTCNHRPHLKTVKSPALAKRMTTFLDTDAITVSTLKEAEVFAAEGYRDILYAVGIVPTKLDRVAALRAKGVDLIIVTDNAATAREISSYCKKHDTTIPVLVEVDCDGHRSGIAPDNPTELLEIAAALASAAELRGVMTHAGGSYAAVTPEQRRACAVQEREAVLLAAQTLRAAGHRSSVTSIGSTPTAFDTDDLKGISEMRAGVYAFFDLVMAGIGVCQSEHIALSVLATVIGHQEDKGWIIVDAGWMAVSRDRGTASQQIDQGYGLVCDAGGGILRDIILVSANQEHGVIAVREGSDAGLPELPVGTQVRILPNHACATAAQHSEYVVLNGSNEEVARWPRFSGW